MQFIEEMLNINELSIFNSFLSSKAFGSLWLQNSIGVKGKKKTKEKAKTLRTIM
jgi:hypothetical protein